MKWLQKLYDFYCPIVEDEGLDLVRSKCDETIAKYEITDPAVDKAIDLRMKVDSFEADLAAKNCQAKPKKEFKFDPRVLIALIGVAGQLLCTGMVEKYQADGYILKPPVTGGIGGNNVFAKLINPFGNKG